MIPYLLGESPVEGSSDTLELVYGEIKSLFTVAKDEKNYKLLETLLLSLAQLGRWVVLFTSH